MIRIVNDQTGDTAFAETSDAAVLAAKTLCQDARDAMNGMTVSRDGCTSSFYYASDLDDHDGDLIMAAVTEDIVSRSLPWIAE
jgi:hypothetical protein